MKHCSLRAKFARQSWYKKAPLHAFTLSDALRSRWNHPYCRAAMENSKIGRRSSRRTDSVKQKYASLFFKEDNKLMTAETRYFNFIRVGETVDKVINGKLYHPTVLQLHCKISYTLFLFINIVLFLNYS